MPDDLMTSEAVPEVEATPVDTPVEDNAEPIEGETPESGVEADAAQPAVGPRYLDASEKAILDKIRAEDPVNGARIAARFRNAVYRTEEFRKAVPGGLKEVNELKTLIEDFGGPEAFESIKAEREEWNALDEQFSKADPKFVESISQTAPDSFLALAPIVMNKFSEMNPEGFSAYVSQIFSSDMLQQGIPLQVELLSYLIPAENTRALEALGKIRAYMGRVDELSRKPVNQPKPKVEPDGREQEFKSREEKLTHDEWISDANRQRINIFDAEFKRSTAGKKISPNDIAAIKELYGSRMKNTAGRDPKHAEKVQRYFGARDRDGYVKYMNSVYKTAIPAALSYAINAILKPGRATAAPAAPRAQGQQAAPKAEQGFVWQSKAPRQEEIAANSPVDWLRQGKALLKNGKKVQWK